MFPRAATVGSRVRRCAAGDARINILYAVRAFSSTPDSFAKNTAPSSSKPARTKSGNGNRDEGFLAFTKSSLYKLTLPLDAPSEETTPISRDANSDSADPLKPVALPDEESSWEEEVERGKKTFETSGKETENHAKPPQVQSVIFLLHSGQPLSYIANLVRAESPDSTPKGEKTLAPDTLGNPPITFHTGGVPSKKRWSPATGIGDFLREAARIGKFTICIGDRNVMVNVPSFEERTRFLRANLHEKTRRIEAMTVLKDECDQIARKAAHKLAFAGAGVMASWWVTVGFLTFRTDLGWDFMEPVTYLTGFGVVIGSYLYFLWHNREVSYRSVLTDTTSRRQHQLYAERGLDMERYHELVEEAKDFRKTIKRIADDYGLEWDQGDTEAGRSAKRALQVVRKDEEKDRRRRSHEGKAEDTEDDSLAQVDDDADGQPDRKN